MKLQAWPRTGKTKRVYINADGRWSVDIWLEPFDHEPGWRLQIKIKDGENLHRRMEIMAEIESHVFTFLAEVIVQQPSIKKLADVRWEDWIIIAKQRCHTF